MRQLAGIATLLFVFFSITATANHVEEYINSYKFIAQKEMKRSGIPASIILAQGIHESAWGRGELAVNSNNHFGIKCKDYWQGPSYYIEDDDYVNGKLVKSCFRSYQNVESSYIDHTDFLVDSDRYNVLFNYGLDYKRWAVGLKKCGYATDPHYAQKLIRIIEEHQLYQFDKIQQEPILEAPNFYIPPQFLHQDLEDPVVYEYQQHSIVQVNQNIAGDRIAETPVFDFEVPVHSVPAPAESYVFEPEVPAYDPRANAGRITVAPVYTGAVTSTIPNNTSRDKRMKNLSRKPRSSSQVGPR